MCIRLELVSNGELFMWLCGCLMCVCVYVRSIPGHDKLVLLLSFEQETLLTLTSGLVLSSSPSCNINRKHMPTITAAVSGLQLFVIVVILHLLCKLGSLGL